MNEEYFEKLKKDFNKTTIPFYDASKGGINFPYKPTLDRLFVFPRPLPEKYKDSSLFIPDPYKHHYRDEYGIVLEKGPGYWYSEGDKFLSMDAVEIGDIIVYDKGVPSLLEVPGLDEKIYEIKLIGVLDVKLIIR